MPPRLLTEGEGPRPTTGSHRRMASWWRPQTQPLGAGLGSAFLGHSPSQGPLCMAGSSLTHKGAVRSPQGSRHRNGGGGMRGGNRIWVLTKSPKARAGAKPALPSRPWSLHVLVPQPCRPFLLAPSRPRTLLLIPQHVRQDTSLIWAVLRQHPSHSPGAAPSLAHLMTSDGSASATWLDGPPGPQRTRVPGFDPATSQPRYGRITSLLCASVSSL